MLGVNLGYPTYWSGERDFMNLVMGDEWRLMINGSMVSVLDPARVDPETGAVRSLAAGEGAALLLTTPAGPAGEVAIRCTWRGDGALSAGGSVRDVVARGDSLEFTMTVRRPTSANSWVALTRTNPADPVRAIDCREADAPRDTMFSREFLESLRPFGVIRFLDWQNVNANKGGRWSQRTRPTSMIHGKNEGVAIEHMIALARELGADPWLHVPYNADADYIRRFAQLVHDRLPASQKVYIELSNEAWNYMFPVAHQAQQEGLDAGLSEAPFRALLYRYAQKATAAYDIWKEVFADRPGQLVRVLGTQSANPWVAEQLLGWTDTAARVDALATAPYFGFNPNQQTPAPANMDEMMVLLAERADATLENDLLNKAIARRYGKRHVAYEGGQHVLMPGDIPMLRDIQRHPKMYDLYARYLRLWREREQDLMVLFNATYPTSQHGAWGLREYAGQPLSQTPKRRAAVEAAAEAR